MEDILQINLNRGTNFEFELSITGISADSAKVTFGLEFPGMCTFQFPCKRGDDGSWSVSIPSLDKYMDEGNYSYTIELVVDGYHFAPVKGTAHVAPVAEVKGSVPHSKVEVSFGGLKVTDDTETEVKDETEKAEVEAVEKAEEKEDKKVTESVKPKKRSKPLDKSKSILSQLNEKSDEEIEAEQAGQKNKAVKNLIKDL